LYQCLFNIKWSKHCSSWLPDRDSRSSFNFLKRTLIILAELIFRNQILQFAYYRSQIESLFFVFAKYSAWKMNYFMYVQKSLKYDFIQPNSNNAKQQEQRSESEKHAFICVRLRQHVAHTFQNISCLFSSQNILWAIFAHISQII